MPRNGLPRRPFIGEAGFTGVPPRGETRFISNEMVFHVPPNVPPATVDAAARRLGLVTVASHNLSLSGGTLLHFRIDNGRPVSDVVRELEGQNIGVAQPNYVYRLQQDARTPAPLSLAPLSLAALPPLPNGDPAQYAVAKLHLTEAHKIATGAGVLVAVINSQIDTSHPDLGGTIAGSFDAVGNREKPDEHGTEMTGAIVAHRKLLGVAPRARILAIHAFSPEAQSSAQTTTAHILAGIDWAIAKGARVINMSFAGPYDPLLSHALKKAHDKGIVLVAAAGNAGPQSPPLYPAADENVIAVTAVDENDKLLPQANQGPHVALAAPGVNVLEPAPGGTYGYTTGTSVATAHVSGVAALIIERDPNIDTATLEEVLYSSARDLGPKGRDSQFGYGLVDPLHALDTLEAKVAMSKGTAPVTATATPMPKPVHVSATAEKMTVSQLPPNQAQSESGTGAIESDGSAASRSACRPDPVPHAGAGATASISANPSPDANPSPGANPSSEPVPGQCRRGAHADAAGQASPPPNSLTRPRLNRARRNRSLDRLRSRGRETPARWMRAGWHDQGPPRPRPAGLCHGLPRRGATDLPQAGGGAEGARHGSPRFHGPLPGAVARPSPSPPSGRAGWGLFPSLQIAATCRAQYLHCAAELVVGAISSYCALQLHASHQPPEPLAITSGPEPRAMIGLSWRRNNPKPFRARNKRWGRPRR